jgi:lipopolysaccharide export LptBFGC system permease protein LptF
VNHLDPYVLRKLCGPFTAGLGIFMAILLIVPIMTFVELVADRAMAIGMPPFLFASILPGFFEVTVPMALPSAIPVTCGRTRGAEVS